MKRNLSLVALLFCAGVLLPAADAPGEQPESSAAVEDQIVGTWIGGGFLGGTLTLTPDGLFIARPLTEDKPDLAGTWTLDGRTLRREITLAKPNKRVGEIMIREILKITDTKMTLKVVGRDPGGTFTYRRFKKRDE